MVTKAILLNTGDFTDRPKDPAPLAVLLQEMKEYCKRNNYTVIEEVNSHQKFIYEKNTPLAKLILENSTGTDDIVIVRFGKIYEQVEGDTIDPELTRLVAENRLRTEPIEHPCVAPPRDGNTRIWRYLTFQSLSTCCSPALCILHVSTKCENTMQAKALVQLLQ